MDVSPSLFLLLWWIFTVMPVSAAAHYSCSGPLVSSLPPSSFQSSSQSTFSSVAHHARVNRRDGSGGWSPLLMDREPWLQLDLREQTEVTAVATQGRSSSSDWVRRYLLLYSDTGQVWKEYCGEDGGQVFVGNVNSDSVVQNKLSPSLRTRFLRFVPLDWNPGGGIGLRVEVYGCSYKSDVADFDGRSSLLYRFNQKSMSTVKDVISLRFKSRQAEGVLVHGEGQRGDHLTLELHKGKLSLYLHLDDTRLRFSSSLAAVTLGSLLDDQFWHSVTVERFNRQVNVSLDSHTQHFTTRGQGKSLEVDYELSFGGIPLPGKPGTFLRRNFDGCMENLYYNGINIIDLAKRRKPQIYTGNVTFSCSRPSLLAITFLSSSSSYLSLPSPSASLGGFSVHLQFRTWNTDGLLMSSRLSGDNQRLSLRIRDNRLILNIDEKTALEISTGQQISDGLWHSVSLDTRDLQVSLTLDSEPASTMQRWELLEVQGGFYFGGCPPAGCPGQMPSFQGCMRLISINNHTIDLRLMQKGMLGVYNELQFDTCSIRDRCVPNLCEHGGVCLQTWSSSSCDCSKTGYTGAVCHQSMYEASCEAYRLTGASSGFYSIDPDGSGPLGPILVYCNMTEERIWMVVHHNVSTPVIVHGSSLQNPHIMTFNYSSAPKHLHDITSRSEHCQQEVVYSCRKSRLFTEDGSPLAWWVDRGGKRQSYWGGSVPGVQGCSCSFEETCIDPNYLCNCDADSPLWTTDSGFLTNKNHLPLSAMVIGDTHRVGSEAVFAVGPLRCHGDRWISNAASFHLEVSSLLFPPLLAELSSDFSFFFKTSAADGVFLENLGHKHFIRLELSSPSVVTFSFDVGDGPVVVVVTSPYPLNDRQWHQVRAERNVKEAWLQVDQLPFRLLEAPVEGQQRLRLNRQLVVGGSSLSQFRGFIGCLRTLNINGVMLDLEEKARLVPGVSSGCPGYCSASSSLCHNRGRCIETADGYRCDCSTSAYGGPTCREEVSVWLHRESSLTFVLQDSSSVMNGSSRDRGRANEDVSFSFITSHSPAHLLTISTFSQQCIAIVLATNGSLQIWYHLEPHRQPDVFSPAHRSLSDGQLHPIRIQREGRQLYVQVDQDVYSAFTMSSDSQLISLRSLTVGKVLRGELFDEELLHATSSGFVGCFSSLRFNHMTPLKTALQNRGSSLVTVRGSLVQSSCSVLTDSITSHNLRGNSHGDSEVVDKEKMPQGGDTQSDVAVITGVLTAITFITVCVLAVVTRIFYLKQVNKNDSITEKEQCHITDTQTRPEPQRPERQGHAIRENMKEYYI
ncbi:contactin-associated protein-like 5 [Cheilinus undulatus]|uniref:contactin-associated protein-like 5 n=1 Tax=Cheilinus undulatus TaxID=241271 RepID=UPI001BD4C78C|nr:contactin-associated protein-like 5 [Cheilinus undulatus]